MGRSRTSVIDWLRSKSYGVGKDVRPGRDITPEGSLENHPSPKSSEVDSGVGTDRSRGRGDTKVEDFRREIFGVRRLGTGPRRRHEDLGRVCDGDPSR